MLNGEGDSPRTLCYVFAFCTIWHWHLLPLGLLEKRVQSRAPETRKNLIIGHAQHYSSKFRTRYHGVDSCRCRHCVARDSRLTTHEAL